MKTEQLWCNEVPFSKKHQAAAATGKSTVNTVQCSPQRMERMPRHCRVAVPSRAQIRSGWRHGQTWPECRQESDRAVVVRCIVLHAGMMLAWCCQCWTAQFEILWFLIKRIHVESSFPRILPRNDWLVTWCSFYNFVSCGWSMLALSGFNGISVFLSSF